MKLEHAAFLVELRKYFEAFENKSILEAFEDLGIKEIIDELRVYKPTDEEFIKLLKESL